MKRQGGNQNPKLHKYHWTDFGRDYQNDVDLQSQSPESKPYTDKIKGCHSGYQHGWLQKILAQFMEVIGINGY